MVEKLEWLGEDQKKFLLNGQSYIKKDQSIEQRYQQICNTIQKIVGENVDYDFGKLHHINVKHSYNLLEIGKRFENYIEKGWISFASPILANFGEKENLPISCNHGWIEDNLNSILKELYSTGMLAKYGAGTAKNFSKIRPIGEPISTGGQSDGIIPWIKLYDTLISSVNQGCYTKDTDILTEKGWISFKDIVTEKNKGIKVCQVEEDGSTSFVNPLDYMSFESDGELIKFVDSKNLNIMVTKNHNMVFKRQKKKSQKKDKNGKIISHVKTMNKNFELIDAENCPTHRDIHMWYGGKSMGGYNTKLSWEEKLKIAYQADGTNIKRSKYKYSFRFSKKRKIDRLCLILKKLNIPYTNKTYDGRSWNIIIDTKISLNKDLKWVQLDKVNEHWAINFLREVSRWDGSLEKNTRELSFTYSSVVKNNVDTIQSVASLCGYKSYSSSIIRDKNRKELYKIYITSKEYFCVDKTEKTYVNLEKQMVYCVEVPSNKLIVRSNGRTFVCGNSVRRGFLTAYLSADHKEIMDFLDIGTPGSEIQRITTAVTLPKGFRNSLKEGNSKNRKIWAKILKRRSEIGYPYILDEENCNKNYPKVYEDKGLWINNANICIEAIEYADEDKEFACCLSSVNVSKYDEWKEDNNFLKDCYVMLDCVITEYIEKGKKLKGLEKAVKFAEEHRAIGLGVLGFHTYLQKKMIPFGSLRSYGINNEIFKKLREEGEEATKIMSYCFGEPKFLEGYQRRNTSLMAQAPTKSTSFIMGSLSSGIEPIKSNYHEKALAKIQTEYKNPELKKLLSTKDKDDRETWKSILINNGSVQHLNFLNELEKEVFKTFSEISQMDIIKLSAQRQKYIDMGQSINLMIHPETSPKDINKLYLEAFDLGIKSLYYQYSINAAQNFNKSLMECSACEA